MPGDLRELIAASHGADAAEAWSKFKLGEADKLVLGDAGKRTLLLFSGQQAGQCALMSATYAWAIEKLATPQAYVVAGQLYIGNHRIFGENGEFEGKRIFSKSNMDWNGHVWVVYGDWIADVSLLRTARGGSLHRLKSYVSKTFKPTNGLMCCQMDTMGGYEFRYVPQYVLPQEEVEGLQRGAVAVLDAQDAKKDG